MNVLRFAKWFNSQGEAVSLWCVEGSPLHKESLTSGLRVQLIQRHKKYGDIINSYRLAKRFEEHQIDVLWIRDTRDMSVCGNAKAISKQKVKLVYQQAMQLGVKKKDFIHTSRFKRIDIWVSPLQFLADQVKAMTNFPPSRIRVIPLALDTSKFVESKDQAAIRSRLGLPEKAVLLGNIGRIDPLKGQAFLIRCHAELLNNGFDVHLAIIGEPTKNEGDAYLDQLKELTRTLKTDEKVHFLPFQSDVENAFAALDIFAMTSVGETFGMVTIEAMTSGLPVIGTNSSGTPELLGFGEFGVLYEPDNQEQFTEGMQLLLENAETRQAMGRKAQDSAISRFSNKEVLKRLTVVLHELTDKKNQTPQA